jgi:hypothetical protein
MNSKVSKPHSIPDSSNWQPRENAAYTLQSAFAKRCISVEKLIRLRSQLERQMNIDNFDSGPGTEDILREELRKLCPSRYSINCGVINDSRGRTAGDFDLIIFNEIWFPQIKAGATPQSRRVHYPIEGVYAVGEIKQTLDAATLDASMEKLVTCHRLYRPTVPRYRIVENWELHRRTSGISNPLYSFIIATELGEGTSFDEIARRFFDINKTLKRLEVVRCLCILGHGTIVWGIKNAEVDGSSAPALFMDDLNKPIFPVSQRLPDTESALFPLTVNLLMHLFHSVLAPEDLAASYGYESIPTAEFPDSPEFWLFPDG